MRSHGKAGEQVTLEDAAKTRVHQKWGFGMAPVKPGVQDRRLDWADAVLDLVQHGALTCRPTAQVLEALSEIKGLFNRVHRADQWDWFTVWVQFGRLSPRKGCQPAAQALASMRKALVAGESDLLEKAIDDFEQVGGLRALRDFRHGRLRPHEVGLGYLYVLSTREQPDLLKIGCTNRDVVERVNEINRATGVVIPYGVLGLWAVREPESVEKGVHQLLTQYRVRPDREFFQVRIGVAVREITQFIKDRATER